MDAHRKRIPFEYSLKTQRLHQMLSTLRGGRNDIEFYIPWDIVDVQCMDWDKIWDSYACRRQVDDHTWCREHKILQETLKNFQIAGESCRQTTAPAGSPTTGRRLYRTLKNWHTDHKCKIAGFEPGTLARRPVDLTPESLGVHCCCTPCGQTVCL